MAVAMRVFSLVVLLLMASPAISLEYGTASVDDGNATAYDDGNYHHRVATGAMFNPYSMTAAHRTLPLGTIVQVTNLDNGQRIYVKINDVGPCASKHCQRLRPDLLNRIVDLTPNAADQLGLRGLGPVALRICKIHHGQIPIRICQ